MLGVVQGRQVAALVRHGDDPGFVMARVLEGADVGLHVPGREFGAFETGRPIPEAACRRGDFSRAVAHRERALQPQPVVPALRLARRDQLGPVPGSATS